jgi:hypothetical protein
LQLRRFYAVTTFNKTHQRFFKAIGFWNTSALKINEHFVNIAVCKGS